MTVRYIVLISLSLVWLLAAVAVTVATFALVDESGWPELPLYAWPMLALIYAVALPGLVYGWRLPRAEEPTL